MGEKKTTTKKSALNFSLGGASVPIAVVLVGALLIFGVNKILTTEKTHRDLVNELQSKTFGNKWVAAFELSKLLAAQSIPEYDIPWVIENLSYTYKTSNDIRTKNFIVLALGSLKSKQTVPVLLEAAASTDEKLSFNAIVALGNSPEGHVENWTAIINKLSSEDKGVVQAAIFALGHHKVSEAIPRIEKIMESAQGSVLRYHAAVSLIALGAENQLPVLKELFELAPKKLVKTDQQGRKPAPLERWDVVKTLKLNALKIIEKEKWLKAKSIVSDIATKDQDLNVSTRAQEVLNKLKY